MTSASESARRRSLIIGLTIVFFGTLVLVVMSPTPMRPATGAEVSSVLEAPIGTLESPDDRVAIPGEHGLSVRSVSSGVVIETADGGGAGFVHRGAARGAMSQVVVGRVDHHDGRRFAALLQGDTEQRAIVVFDERGVRSDDGLIARLIAIDGTYFGVMLFSIITLAWLRWRSRG